MGPLPAELCSRYRGGWWKRVPARQLEELQADALRIGSRRLLDPERGPGLQEAFCCGLMIGGSSSTEWWTGQVVSREHFGPDLLYPLLWKECRLEVEPLPGVRRRELEGPLC